MDDTSSTVAVGEDIDCELELEVVLSISTVSVGDGDKGMEVGVVAGGDVGYVDVANVSCFCSKKNRKVRPAVAM